MGARGGDSGEGRGLFGQPPRFPVWEVVRSDFSWWVQTNEALRVHLKRNRLPTTGCKEELIQRVAEGATLGVVPKCR